MEPNWFEQFDEGYSGLITATVLADSVNMYGNRLTTMQLSFPRIILPEVLTHRVFSRNTASNRAKPLKVTLSEVYNKPFKPAVWLGRNKGMQSFSHAAWFQNFKADVGYWIAQKTAMLVAKYLMNGVSKQQVNRILEPYQYTSMVVSATDFDNFFELRDNYAAQLEIQTLARKMKEAMRNSTPIQLSYGDVHLPYILPAETSLSLEDKLKISVARAARNSYKDFNTIYTSSTVEDTKLFNKLLKEKHLSPFEHQALSVSDKAPTSNFNAGWRQFRWYVESYAKPLDTLSEDSEILSHIKVT